MKTLHRLVKRAIDGCCLAMVSPLAGLCALESRSGGGDACFTFSAQLGAPLPGLPGVFLRRAFYRLTLESCGRSFLPIYFALQPLLARSGLSYWSRVTVLLVICGPVLACVSEAIQKVAAPDRLRAALLSFGSGPIDIEGLRLLRRRFTP